MPDIQIQMVQIENGVEGEVPFGIHPMIDLFKMVMMLADTQRAVAVELRRARLRMSAMWGALFVVTVLNVVVPLVLHKW